MQAVDAPALRRPLQRRSLLVRSVGQPGSGQSEWRRRRERVGLWFIIPFVIAFVLFLVVPLGYAVYESLYTTKLVGGTKFSGVSNYLSILHSAPFWTGFLRVMVFGAIQIPVTLVIAFGFASLFDLGIARFGRFFRVLYFVPFAVPAVVAAVMWSFLLEPQFGPLVHAARGLGAGHVNFFSSGLLLPSIIVIVIWEWTGYNMTIMYTALKAVPREVVEAAIIDGTPVRKIITRIKFPMVRPAIVMLVFLNSIGALQLFTEPLILNSFQPGSVSDAYTPTLFIYNTAIAGGEYGLAAAGAVVLGLVVILISVGAMLFRRRKGEFG